LLTEYWFGW